MQLSIKNYKHVLPQELLKKAEKDIIRECDEIDKGHFQAYVDENDKTFDTFLILSNTGEVTAHGCDCPGKIDICQHEAALLLFLLKGKKIKVPKIISNKSISSIESLVNSVDPDKLKEWAIDLLTRNKDLGIAFKHQFSTQIDYSPSEIKQLTFDAVKAVVKNRKKLEISEVKKIVELWNEIHDAVLQQYCTQMADEDSFLRLNAVLDACQEIQYQTNTSSSRFSKYIHGLLEKIIIPLNQMKDEEFWEKATGYFIDHIRGEEYYLRTYYFSFLADLHELSNTARKKRLAIDLITQYIKVDPTNFYDGESYTFIVFKIIKNSGLFADYYHVFLPIRYRNEYNISLISLLIENECFRLAEKYCLKQIEMNSQPEYDRAYLELLTKIYTLENDDKKLAGVLQAALPLTYDFETYLFIDSMVDAGEEYSKWRNQILGRARQAAPSDPAAMLFSFQMLDYEKNYIKMLDYVDSSASYMVVFYYANKMIAASKAGFLKKLILKTENFREDHTPEGLKRLEPVFYQLLNVLVEHYTSEELKSAMLNLPKNIKYYSPNHFVAFMKDCLGKQ